MNDSTVFSVSRLTMRNIVSLCAPSAVTAGLLWAASAAGRIPIPGTPVPITLQTLVIMLAGLLLTWRQAAGAVVLYLTMGACGLPVFSGGASTMALVGPSAGFLFGFLPAVVATALLAGPARRLAARPSGVGDTAGAAAVRWALRFAACLVAVLLGSVALHYACGLLVQSALTHVPLGALAAASTGFLPGDLIKAVVACAIAASAARR